MTPKKYAIPAAIAFGVFAFGGVAEAHSTSVQGKASCQENGTFTVTWTVSNDYALPEHITLGQTRGGGSLSGIPADIGPNGATTVVQTGVPGTYTYASLDVNASWSDGYIANNGKAINLSGNCHTPSTTTETTPSTTTPTTTSPATTSPSTSPSSTTVSPTVPDSTPSVPSTLPPSESSPPSSDSTPSPSPSTPDTSPPVSDSTPQTPSVGVPSSSGPSSTGQTPAPTSSAVSPTDTALPVTGSNTHDIAWAAGCFLLVGIGLVWITRRWSA